MPKNNPYIFRKKSRLHNYGVFAARDIPEGTRVVQYTGQKMLTSLAETKPNQDYVFELNSKYSIDGRNIARYVNHSCDPNCETDIINGEIWIISIEDIKKGSEITYNYAYDIEEALGYPCRCGTSDCTGYIMDYDDWPKFRKLKKQGRIGKIDGILSVLPKRRKARSS